MLDYTPSIHGYSSIFPPYIEQTSRVLVTAHVRLHVKVEIACKTFHLSNKQH